MSRILARFGIRREWAARNVNGGAFIRPSRAEAVRDFNEPRRLGGVDEPPDPPMVAIESRWVTGWKEAR